MNTAPPQKFDMQWLLHQSRYPWFQLDCHAPYAEMLAEAKNLRPRFVKHRTGENLGGYEHRGWASLCLHGLSAEKTMSAPCYGYENDLSAPYRFTEIAAECPATISFLQKQLGYSRYFRVRYMLLEAGGYIRPHKDLSFNALLNLNISLNNPADCEFSMEGHGVVPFQDRGSAFLVDLGNVHQVINHSSEDRYHLIVHGEMNWEHSSNFYRMLEGSYAKKYS